MKRSNCLKSEKFKYALDSNVYIVDVEKTKSKINGSVRQICRVRRYREELVESESRQTMFHDDL